MKWLLSSFPAPLRAFVTPWRLRARLRRSSLINWWEGSRAARNGEFRQADLRQLLKLYDDFEEPAARRAYPKGKYKDFLDYLRSDNLRKKLDEENRRRLVTMTERWHAHYIRSELRNAFVLLTLLLVLLLGVGTVAAGIVVLLKTLGGGNVSAMGALANEQQHVYRGLHCEHVLRISE